MNKYSETRARYKRRDPERWKRYNREYSWRLRDELKLEVLIHYGPSSQLCCSAKDCHIGDVDMLVLDHVNDNGAAQKKELGGGSKGRGWNFYRLLKRLGFPEGYQTLCCNHNQKKEILRSRKQRADNGSIGELQLYSHPAYSPPH